EYERRFVLGLAAQTAQAIDRAMLYEAERGAREHAEGLAARLVRLQMVAAELGAAMSVDEATDVVVTHAAEVVGSGLATVSLRVGSRSIGAISLSFPPGRDVSSRTEIAFFASLADTCAQAVERSRAVSSLETAVARLSFLADATSELATSLDYRTTLAKIASL